MASINAELAGINAQISALAPILSLLTAPTDLGSLLTFATGLITNVLTPMYRPYLTAETQLTELAAQYAALASAIASAAAKLESCTITVPSLG
jgi:hypothetical protein